MGTVNVTLEQEAESIFTDLGYTVSGDGGEIRAERKWRVVQVTPMPEPEDPPSTGEMRCFVTYEDRLAQVEQTLLREDPDYEWAIIGVAEDSDYVVSR
jgi:hypothetical protein